VWAHYATSLIMVLARRCVAITIVLVFARTRLPHRHLRPALGGDPVLFQHLFWFYSHPAVYIMILPAMGVISEIIACFSRKRIFGYSFVAFSSARHRDLRLPRVGPPHVRQRPVGLRGAGRVRFLTFLVAIPRP
jgi:cytochrome c oxidase subunit 1